MTSLEGEELKQALEHDAAIKQAVRDQEAPTAQEEMVEVDPSIVVRGIEIKQAALAKTVSLGLIDFARHCTSLVQAEVTPSMTMQGEEVVSVPPKADMGRINKLLEAAEKALELASRADILGDKSVVRGGTNAEVKA